MGLEGFLAKARGRAPKIEPVRVLEGGILILHFGAEVNVIAVHGTKPDDKPFGRVTLGDDARVRRISAPGQNGIRLLLEPGRDSEDTIEDAARKFVTAYGVLSKATIPAVPGGKPIVSLGDLSELWLGLAEQNSGLLREEPAPVVKA